MEQNCKLSLMIRTDNKFEDFKEMDIDYDRETGILSALFEIEEMGFPRLKYSDKITIGVKNLNAVKGDALWINFHSFIVKDRYIQKIFQDDKKVRYAFVVEPELR